jgi:hypothetical protein
MITKEQKNTLKRFYDVHIESVKIAYESLEKDLEKTKLLRDIASKKEEKDRLNVEMLLINDRISREMGKMDILKVMNFCAV